MKLITLEMKSIRNPAAKFCSLESDAFEALVIDIERHGMMNPIVVRECQDGAYEVLDGCHRLEAARRLNIERIQVSVAGLKDVLNFTKKLPESRKHEPLEDHERARLSIRLLRQAANEHNQQIQEGFLNPETLKRLLGDRTVRSGRYYGINFKADDTLQPWEVRIMMAPVGVKKCQACGGKGRWITIESYHGDMIHRTCQVCKGTGVES